MEGLLAPLKEKISKLYRENEEMVVTELLKRLPFTEEEERRMRARAHELVIRTRLKAKEADITDAFMQKFPLSNQEGVLLMCLAEALLRIPDKDTAKALLEDKLFQADFEKHLGKSPSTLVNLSTRGLTLAQAFLKGDQEKGEGFNGRFRNLLARSSEPLIRKSALQAMQMLANKFVMGKTIQTALKAAPSDRKKGYTHSYDMLGEAAFTRDDARRYFEAYLGAIEAVGKENQGLPNHQKGTISIKLSALHPRYVYAQKERVLTELYESLLALCLKAEELDVGVTIDAEEAERLEISLELLEKLSLESRLEGWNGLGLAVQAYQKRATAVLSYLAELARATKRRFNVRLVKGAYWDSEIKRTQELGLKDYPVFTRKASTDLSYLVCAQFMLSHRDVFYCQFATHNAQTLSTILEMAGENRDFEFQKLYGMGNDLYSQVVGETNFGVLCRIYAPVGQYKDLLPYLVRRLLENGANSSFVNHIHDEKISIEDIVENPLEKVKRVTPIPHPKIPLPRVLYPTIRLNSIGSDLTDKSEVEYILNAINHLSLPTATPIVNGSPQTGKVLKYYNPADRREEIGEVIEATNDHVVEALLSAEKAADAWALSSTENRALSLEKMASLLERDRYELMALVVKEGGKSLPDAVAEIREAVDFCRYYANRGREDFGKSIPLPSPTGEKNELRLMGRGIFICVSPWNFPLAIFTGQVAAALMAGNCVIAKPARQTPLIAHKAIRLFHEAGIPGDVLHFLPGPGSRVAAHLIEDKRTAGVCFTGSTETAWQINRTLAAKEDIIVPFIAETGGQNVMFVDSSSLPEQVVSDVIVSAFQSAGQRCSALRVLMLQEEIADHVLEMLRGSMAELVIGDPKSLSTDVGPVIDQSAKESLEEHIEHMKRKAKLIYQCSLDPEQTGHGTFVPPTAFEIDSLHLLKKEVFGPILHVVRYSAKDLERVIEEINGLRYGLTFGLHTRIDAKVAEISKRIKAGNVYVNRNMIGAVVGVQPFGGRGLSGTGPKAGGFFYLHRFATEQTVTINTTAQGGNTTLMNLE